LPAIARANPFAAGVRRRLLDALESLDHALAEPVGEPSLPALEIPDLGARSPSLRETRVHIEELDRELTALLARRAELARRAAHAKSEIGVGIVDPTRELALLAERRAWAETMGLPPEEVEEVFRAVVRLSRKVQAS
jgi:prephenate dehydrogenase